MATCGIGILRGNIVAHYGEGFEDENDEDSEADVDGEADFDREEDYCEDSSEEFEDDEPDVDG